MDFSGVSSLKIDIHFVGGEIYEHMEKWGRITLLSLAEFSLKNRLYKSLNVSTITLLMKLSRQNKIVIQFHAVSFSSHETSQFETCKSFEQ